MDNVESTEFESLDVNPFHVVPKKTGLTIVKNEKVELIPTRVQNSWRVCIDYKRLNQETRREGEMGSTACT